MNQFIPLYSFVRSGASIYIVRIDSMQIQSGSPGQQIVSLQFGIEETLWGKSGKPIRRAQYTQPESEIARLKFPDPIWGQVNPREGARLLLITHELSDAIADPLYVEEILDSADPALSAIREILDNERVLFEQERKGQDGQARRSRYLNYLGGDVIVKELFGAEALAKDGDLPEIDPAGKVAQVMAAVFASDQVIFVRLSVGAWMWDSIYPRTNLAGQVAILNATLGGISDDSEDIRRFSLDQLAEVDPADVHQPGVMSSPEAVQLLQEQLAQETDPEVRDHLQKLIDALPK
jgi:hypothetical protein